MNKAEVAFEKIAKLSIENLEDSIGLYLSDKQEQVARDMMESEKEKSFILRHPVLTGIPTLGIAPAYMQNKVESKIIRHLTRSDAAFSKAVNLLKEQRRKEILENYELETGRLKADQPTRATAIGTLGAMSLMDTYMSNRNNS